MMIDNPLALFKVYRALKKKGIMGMNFRNHRIISRYNKRSLYPLVDNKLKTKQLALAHALHVPELIGVVREQHDIATVESLLKHDRGFCIKPAQGSGGKGILVVLRDEQGRMQRTDGRALEIDEIQRHLSNILAGIFSLGGKSDVALIEDLIIVDPIFKSFTYEGVPDLRIIVFRGYPTMAMMRLSCHESKGKANLHQGAVGVGIDIVTGRALNAVQHGLPVTHHPDTKQLLSELVVPRWEEMIKLACACCDMTGLGYIGVDLVLDKNKGPLVLELNARPGLAIQVANNAGLLPRLTAIEQFPLSLNIDERIQKVTALIRSLKAT